MILPHPHPKATILGILHQKVGNYKEALKLHRKVEAGVQKKSGSYHHQVIAAKVHIREIKELMRESS